MPRSNTPKPQFAAMKDIGELFDYPNLSVKLREDLCVLTRHQRVVIKLRAQIPEAKNSDARNAIQEITNLFIHWNDHIEELIEGVLDRKIEVYHKARKIKAEARTVTTAIQVAWTMSAPTTRPLTVVTPETAISFIATIAARIKDFKIAAISSTTDTKEAAHDMRILHASAKMTTWK
ncbi:hypothetical protein DYB31_013969 [Aphanomyces astaci]|uniref:Uncharacterized protein n=1 Tax=Aphanomyces astaci TaxID=112090 RepID=A0A397FMA8_APHAT|nr:hypothetical protein DYB31_013969 [Aphanomyces astaci]